MSKINRKIYAALPVLNEFENIGYIIDLIKDQDYSNFELIVCVNQPDEWWDTEEKADIISNNQKTIEFLISTNDFNITVLDKSSKGKGWKGKNHGIGEARKLLFDTIMEIADDNDIILSLDADTTFSPQYFSSIVENISKNNRCTAIAVPYYHKLVENERLNRAMLRYEIYMRNYALNLWRINSPYCFTALGSAIAVPVWSCKKIGGLSPKKSGEDFYFLQKLRKSGQLLFWNEEHVYPGNRFSDRVYFGTGPAMIKGDSGDWLSYPIYHYELFDDIAKTYELFPGLFITNCNTPLDDFLQENFKEENIWDKLRDNTKNIKTFTKACHDKVDGLRILQYLKNHEKNDNRSAEENLIDFIQQFCTNAEIQELNLQNLSFENSPISDLNKIRDFLFAKEYEYQKFSS